MTIANLMQNQLCSIVRNGWNNKEWPTRNVKEINKETLDEISKEIKGSNALYKIFF